MKTIRITIHGLVLLLANLVGIFVGFLIYRALGTSDQLATQLPIAALLSIMLYLAWVLLLRALPRKNLGLQGTLEHVLAGACSLLWNPIVFTSLHFVTQGYLTSTGNIVTLAMFQIPVNAAALLVAWRVTRPKDQQVSMAEGAPSAKQSTNP